MFLFKVLFAISCCLTVQHYGKTNSSKPTSKQRWTIPISNIVAKQRGANQPASRDEPFLYSTLWQNKQQQANQQAEMNHSYIQHCGKTNRNKPTSKQRWTIPIFNIVAKQTAASQPASRDEPFLYSTLWHTNQQAEMNHSYIQHCGIPNSSKPTSKQRWTSPISNIVAKQTAVNQPASRDEPFLYSTLWQNKQQQAEMNQSYIQHCGKTNSSKPTSKQRSTIPISNIVARQTAASQPASRDEPVLYPTLWQNKHQ